MKITNRNDVKILMLKKNTSAMKISAELNMSINSFYAIISGRFKSPKIEEHIRKVFGVSFENIKNAWNNTGVVEQQQKAV